MATKEAAGDAGKRPLITAAEKTLWGIFQSALIANQVQAGVKTGLFLALAKQEVPVAGEALAAAAGTDPRFTTEWARAMASARVITYTQPDLFSLSAEQRAALASPGAVGDLRGMFQLLESLCGDKAGFVERALRSGKGASYDEQGVAVARGVDMHHAPWMREKLVPFVREHLPAVAASLEADGAVAADIGCGAAGSLVALALAFPKATFHGYESSKEALACAAERIAAAGVGDRVTMHDFGAGARLPTDGSLDFVFSHDVLHDVCDPVGVIGEVYAALKAGSGVYMAGEPAAMPSHDLTIRKNPSAALAYAFSVSLCLQSATCEPGGPALGTAGFTEAVGLALFAQGGFERCDAVQDGPLGNRFFRAYKLAGTATQ